MRRNTIRWYPLTTNDEGEWVAGPAVIDNKSALLFVRLPVGLTTLGRIDRLPFVYIHELGTTMLINAAASGILVLPVE